MPFVCVIGGPNGRWTVYDNSAGNLRVVARGGRGTTVATVATVVEDEAQWRRINR